MCTIVLGSRGDSPCYGIKYIIDQLPIMLQPLRMVDFKGHPNKGSYLIRLMGIIAREPVMACLSENLYSGS